MNQNFDIDDLVWAKFLNYRPWPGRIIRITRDLKPEHLCVQFYGNDDHSQVLINNIFPYLERVDEFTSNIPKNYGSGFYTAINTIHEKYWNLVDLKRDSEDSGFPVDTDEEIEIAIEDRKASHWNPRVLRRPLPQKQDDDDDEEDDDNDDDDDGDDYPDSSWGRTKYKRFKRFKKDKKGAFTKQVQNVTRTKTSTKKTKSKTETSCQGSKASTSGQSCKASTSGQSTKTSSQSKASTSDQSTKTSSQSKASTSGQSTKTSSQSKAKSSPSKATSSSVSFPITKRQKSLHLLRSSTQETTCQNTKASTSKMINAKTTQVKTRKRKSSETLCLSKEDVKPTSKTACSTNSSIETIAAKQNHPSPFKHLILRAAPVDDITIPQDSCSACTIRYGFIGLRSLSQSIIHPLLKRDHIVNVWSKDASKFNALTKAGAVRTNTPAGIITSSDVIFYSTRDPDISKNILLTREGVFDGCERSLGFPKIFVELTNIDIVEPERSIRPLIKFQGGFYLQVKAIIPQIDEKTSPTFICAGDLKVFAAVASCLYHVTRDIHYFGSGFFKDAPMEFTPRIVEELVLQSLQKTTSFLYELGFKIPDFEEVLCHKNFEFGKVVAKLKEYTEAKRNKKIVFYQNM